MGITNNAEEFLLRILNFEIVFEFAEKTDYLFLYKIKECIKHSECPEGAYLSEVANYMDLSMPATSKMITNLEKKGYIIWKLDEKKEQTYIALTSKAIELTNCEKNKIISIYLLLSQKENLWMFLQEEMRRLFLFGKNQKK